MTIAVTMNENKTYIKLTTDNQSNINNVYKTSF